MHGQHADAFGQRHFGDVGEDVPVMPLTPGDGVFVGLCGNDVDLRDEGLGVAVEGNGAAAVGGVEEVDGVNAGARDVHGHVEPFAGGGPADVELVLGRRHEVVGAVVGRGLGVELGVGDVHAFLHAKFVEVRAVGGVDGAAA